MTDSEKIMRALRRIGVSADISVVRRLCESIHSACQHFVSIALMRYIKHYLVCRTIENIVHCYSHFDHTEIGTDMTAPDTELAQQSLAHHGGELFQLVY